MTALLCLYSCDGGDDDGRRLGEVIVGTWQRDEIIIDGDTSIKPEDLTYDLFYFYGDGDYNGMVRTGRKILAQVLSFTDNQMQIRYVIDEYDVTVTVIIRKISDSVK